MFRKQPNLFQDPEIDYPIYDFHLPFSDHVELSRAFIQRTRQDLNSNAELIIDANAPFELRPEEKPRIGVLLIHGLLDSAFLMRDIARQFQQQGMLTRSLLLPGHGTVPGGLLNVKETEWLQTVRYGIASLKSEVEKIILVGYSTGANLSMLCYAENPDKIAGIIAISPAIQIISPLAWASNLPPYLGNLIQRANWLHVSEEVDYAKYTSTTFNCVYQVYQLGKKLLAMNPAIFKNLPLFFLAAYEDEIVSTRASVAFFQKTMNSQSRFLLYTNKKIAMNDARITLRSSVFPELKIQGFSHICLPFSPENSHYGKQGDYIYASHIGSEDISYTAISKLSEKFIQWLCKCKLMKLPIRRLSFNPDFEFTINRMIEFSKTIV